VTLFFDDLHLDDGSLAAARNAAWRYLSRALGLDDRAAVVTSSGQTGIFTGDREKLHDVLFNGCWPIAHHLRPPVPGDR